jgi:CMP-N,N'-diacetyllegionaminic acid synthase
MKNIAIIPARSGSKGLKDKNIKLLNGKPLIAHTIGTAIQSGVFEEIMVSTDSESYAEIAREWGACVPFLRSVELSTDDALSWDVVKDVLIRYKQLGREFDTVALLQPTSPLRSAEDILTGYNKLIEKGANSVIAVCEVDHSPLWSNNLPTDHSLVNFINKEIKGLPRQSLPVYYRINGALYIVKTEFLFCTDDIYRDKSFAIIMTKGHSVDIDDVLDFELAELAMKIKKF